MKSSLVLVCGLVLVLLSMVACTTNSANVTMEVSCDDFMASSQSPVIINKQVNVKTGAMLTVKLCSNQTTGFQWTEDAKISDTSILQQVEHKYTAPGTDMPGAPGEEVWTFKAMKAGTCTVAMEYSRPWEGGEKGVWKYNLTVTVK